MRQDILSKLNRLFSGTIDKVKVTYRSGKLQEEVMKFEMLGHKIVEENNMIKVLDDTGSKFFSPKTVVFVPMEVEDVLYEDDQDCSEIHCRKVVVCLKDRSRIELETVAFG